MYLSALQRFVKCHNSALTLSISKSLPLLKALENQTVATAVASKG